MNLKSINYWLAGLLVLFAVAAAAFRSDPTQPNIEFVPMMRRSPAYDAYKVNQHLPKGRTLQAPVVGTIARGETPLYYEATKEDAERAGLELKNPMVQPFDASSDGGDGAASHIAAAAMPRTSRASLSRASLSRSPSPSPASSPPPSRRWRLHRRRQRAVPPTSLRPVHGPPRPARAPGSSGSSSRTAAGSRVRSRSR